MLLSICVPTYNRKEKLLETLSFLCEELVEIQGIEFELVVGDNCSSDGTYDSVVSFIKDYPFAHIYKNVENLGLVGNLISLVKVAKGKYVWYVGDDDIYYRGIVKTVLTRLVSDTPSLLFINHKAYIKGKENTSGFSSAVTLNKPSKYKDGHKGIVDIWKETKTSLMFISSVVYEKEYLKQAIEREKKYNLASPLYYSFYVGSKGSVSIIKDIFIENVWGNTSWSNSTDLVFYKYVPRILLSLNKWGYAFSDQIGIVGKYFWARKRSVIGCLFY